MTLSVPFLKPRNGELRSPFRFIIPLLKFFAPLSFKKVDVPLKIVLYQILVTLSPYRQLVLSFREKDDRGTGDTVIV